MWFLQNIFRTDLSFGMVSGACKILGGVMDSLENGWLMLELSTVESDMSSWRDGIRASFQSLSMTDFDRSEEALSQLPLGEKPEGCPQDSKILFD